MTDWSDQLDLSGLEQQNGLPPGWLSSAIQAESSGNPNAVSSAGATGLMQLMPGTAKQYGVTDSTDPQQNVAAGAQYYGDLFKKYGGNPAQAAAAYNWGPGNLDKKGIKNAPAETQGYISKILSGIGNAIVPSAQAAETDPANMDADEELTAANAAKTPQRSQEFQELMGNANGSPAPRSAEFQELMGNANRQSPSSSGGLAITINNPNAIDARQNPPTDDDMSLLSRIAQIGGDPKTELEGTISTLDAPARYLENKFPGLATADTALGMSTAEQAHATHVQDAQKNPLSFMLGQGAGTVGEMELGGAALSGLPGVNYLTNAASGLPAVARYGLVNPATAAATGAIAGGLGSGGNNEPVGTNMLAGAGVSGLLGLVPGAAALAGKAGETVRGWMPAAAAAKSGMAQNILESEAGGPISIPSSNPLVAGSNPTMAELTQNPGLANLERSLRDLDPTPFVANENARNVARNQAWADLKGTADDFQALKDDRDEQTTVLRNAAFAPENTSPVNSAPVARTIQNILDGPQGQRDSVVRALTPIQKKLTVPYADADKATDALSAFDAINQKIGNLPEDTQGDVLQVRSLLNSVKNGKTASQDAAKQLSKITGDWYEDDEESHPSNVIGPDWDNAISQAQKILKSPNIKFQSDPAQLYGIRKSITDQLESIDPAVSAAARTAKSQLMPILDKLDATIESGAPGYSAYMNKFSEMSRPIDAMGYLQSRDLTDMKGNISLPKIQNTLKNIDKQQAASGLNDAKSLTDEHIAGLTAIRDDLLNQKNTQDMGRSFGSNSIQNAATQKRVAQQIPGSSNPLVGSYVHPEVVGGLLGEMAGSAVGMPGLGAGLGAGAGRAVANRLSGQAQDVRGRLTNMLLNPGSYSPGAGIQEPGTLARIYRNKLFRDVLGKTPIPVIDALGNNRSAPSPE